MELAVYTCRTDALLFVPAMCLPPRDAEDTFGPLEPAGRVIVDDAAPGAWRDILAQIERHLFATLPAAQAVLLIDASPARTPGPTEA